MKFCKSISPIEEVHQMELLRRVEGTTYEETPMDSPKICFSSWIPVREKESQREQCLLDECLGQDFGIAGQSSSAPLKA